MSSSSIQPSALHFGLHRLLRSPPFRSERNECAVVESVVISKSHRGLGLGRNLVHEVEAACLSLGLEEIHLSTFDQFIFYQRLGYIQYAEGKVPTLGNLVST